MDFKAKMYFDLEINLAYVIIALILIVIVYIAYKHYYKKHHLEIKKISFLFNVISFEYEPIQDEDKKELYLKLEDRDKQITELNERIKVLQNEKFSLSIILFLMWIGSLLLLFFKRRAKAKTN
jgi:hypothetical protein